MAQKLEQGNVSTSADFVRFGMPYEEYPLAENVSACCITGGKFNCPQEANLDNCKPYMAQRCADKWDGRCEQYIEYLDREKDIFDFIDDVATRKYCKLREDSSCVVAEEPFYPINQTSPQIKRTIGNEVFKNKADSIDIGWYYKSSLSPVMMDKCKYVCDASKVEERDPVFNICGKYNLCKKNIVDMCFNPTASETKNENLRQICSKLNPKLQKEGFNYSPTGDASRPKPSFSIQKLVLLIVLLCVLIIAGVKYVYPEIQHYHYKQASVLSAGVLVVFGCLMYMILRHMK